jgi:hypothetical protein
VKEESMTTAKIRLLFLLAIAGLAVFLVFGRNPSTQATSPTVSPAPSTPSTYEYKVELVKHNKDLEGVLQTDGSNGWRVRDVAIGPYRDELVVVLERGGSAP